jgi:hypothetical protein
MYYRHILYMWYALHSLMRGVMYDDMSIKVRVDEQGFTHITVTEYTEDGAELVFVANEDFQAEAIGQCA